MIMAKLNGQIGLLMIEFLKNILVDKCRGSQTFPSRGALSNENFFPWRPIYIIFILAAQGGGAPLTTDSRNCQN